MSETITLHCNCPWVIKDKIILVENGYYIQGQKCIECERWYPDL